MFSPLKTHTAWGVPTPTKTSRPEDFEGSRVEAFLLLELHLQRAHPEVPPCQSLQTAKVTGVEALFQAPQQDESRRWFLCAFLLVALFYWHVDFEKERVCLFVVYLFICLFVSLFVCFLFDWLVGWLLVSLSVC